MNKYVKCPHCGHRSITKIGMYIKATTVAHIDDYVERPWFKDSRNNWPTIERLRKNKNILGFYCKNCNKPFPDRQTKAILDYCRYKKYLNRLKS